MNRISQLALVVVTLSIAAATRAEAQQRPWRRHTIDASSRGADGVRVADVNGDRWPDLVTGWEEGGKVRLYLNPGPKQARQPWPAVTVGNVGSPEDAVFADLDGDGDLDIVTCEERDNLGVIWYENPTR